MRTRTNGFVSVHAARTNNPDRWFLFFHYPRLYAAGMCAQQPVRILMNIKCVLHVPRRMIFGQVERCEIVPVIFNLRTLCYGKSESSKDLHNAVSHDADRMSGAHFDWIAGKTPIYLVGSWRLAVASFTPSYFDSANCLNSFRI